ncbi:MAG: Coq4 family protein [Parvibaculales bacterium]
MAESIRAAKKPNFLDALRAVRRLMKDNEDTAQVFTILEAMGQRAIRREWNRFEKAPIADKILAEPHLIEMLCDRPYLQALPEGSLGRTYFDFTQVENITPDGLVQASEDGLSHVRKFTPEQEKFHLRQRDAHDLWHVVTGYGRDQLGELCLLGVTYKMIDNPGFLLIILFGLMQNRKMNPQVSIMSALREAFRNGGRMAWLPEIDWRDAMARPLEDLRAEWNVLPPHTYHATRDRLSALDSSYLKQAAE